MFNITGWGGGLNIRGGVDIKGVVVFNNRRREAGILGDCISKAASGVAGLRVSDS